MGQLARVKEGPWTRFVLINWETGDLAAALRDLEKALSEG